MTQSTTTITKYFKPTVKSYQILAEVVFASHLIWTVLSPLQFILLYIVKQAYIPYFIAYILLNILAPMPFRGCPLTKLEKYFRLKSGQTLDDKLTFVQRLSTRWFKYTPARWKIHLSHGLAYVIAILVVISLI